MTLDFIRLVISHSPSNDEEVLPKRLQAFEDFHSAFNKSDIHSGSDALRTFFDYRPPQLNINNNNNINGESGSHQHALLSLASFLLSNDMTDEAKKVTNESLTMSRISKDIKTLNGCNRLIRQFNNSLSITDPITTPINQQDLKLIDELNDIKILLNVGDNLNNLFLRQYRSLVRLDKSITTDIIDGGFQSYASVASILFDLLGSINVRNIYQSLGNSGLTWHTSSQLSIKINIANQQALNGNYGNCIKELFDDRLLDQMNIVEYSIWANAVWGVLKLRNDRLTKVWKGPPNAQFNYYDRESQPWKIKKLIDDSKNNEGNREKTLENFLHAFKLSDDFNFVNLKLEAQIELIGFENKFQYGLTIRQSGVLAKALNSNNKEIESRAYFIFGEKLILDRDYYKAIQYILKSLEIYLFIEDRVKVSDCLYVLIGIYQSLNDDFNVYKYANQLIRFENESEDLLNDWKFESRISSLIQQYGIIISQKY